MKYYTDYPIPTKWYIKKDKTSNVNTKANTNLEGNNMEHLVKHLTVKQWLPQFNGTQVDTANNLGEDLGLTSCKDTANNLEFSFENDEKDIIKIDRVLKTVGWFLVIFVVTAVTYLYIKHN